jgi:glycerophosphoryl diester phosphodiesterase
VVSDGLDTAEAVVEAVAGHPVELWLAADDAGMIDALRALTSKALVLARTRLTRLKDGPERHAATLAAGGIDGVVFPYIDWTGGMAALYHRFERLAVAEDAQHERVLSELVRMGVDAIVTDWPDRAVDAIRLVKNPPFTAGF